MSVVCCAPYIFHIGDTASIKMLNYRYLNTDGEFDDIEEQEMPEPESSEGNELMALLLALVTPKAM